MVRSAEAIRWGFGAQDNAVDFYLLFFICLFSVIGDDVVCAYKYM